MYNTELISSIFDEINVANENGYLTKNQVNIVLARKNDGLAYEQLISKFNISCKNALIHCLLRTCMIEYWNHGMAGQGINNLSSYNEELFISIIKNADDDKNCIPTLYAISLAPYIKKKRN